MLRAAEAAELTRQELCAQLKVSESTVRRWEVEGLPCEGLCKALGSRAPE